MSSDYGDFCKEMREETRRLRIKYGQPCPKCIELLPKAHPSILLPGQMCKIHKYRDPRQRVPESARGEREK